MYEFNGWFVLKESAEDEPGARPDPARVANLTDQLAQHRWSASLIDLVQLDRQFCMRMTGMLNRNRGESQVLHDLIGRIARDLPGSYGLLYEWSDEPDLPSPPGDGAFQVHVLERGQVSRRMDPFLSPTQPVLEG